jgi:hypothetical protein
MCGLEKCCCIFYFHPAMFIPRATMILLASFPLVVRAQSADNELPLPRLKDVSVVVKVRHDFTPHKPGTNIRVRDTQSVFLIGPDGYAYTQYFCSAGNCLRKEAYEYQQGQLTRKRSFGTIDRHSPFAASSAHSHQPVSEDIWTYRGGKLISAKNMAGPASTPTRTARYSYDGHGRITAVYYTYPPQRIVYYPAPDDAVRYCYSGDSVCRLRYKNGALRDSSAYIERRNKAGLVTERWQVSRDEAHFEKERYLYDSSNRITGYEYTSDAPVLKKDGTVLHADRIEYTYDAEGRPDEVCYFARGIKRWAFQYNYVR